MWGAMTRQFLPDRSVRAALAGIEAAGTSWVVIALVSMVAYTATAAAPGLAGATWSSAVGVGTGFWALGFGGTFVLDEGTISLIPLGITAFSALLLRSSMRRAALENAIQLGFTVGAYVLAVLLLGLANGVGIGRHLLGAALLAALIGGLSLRFEPLVRLAERIPAETRLGLRLGAKAAVMITVAAAALAATALVIAIPRITELSAVTTDVVSAAVLLLLQLAYLPNVVIWTVAWLAGPGFMFGSGTIFGPGLIVAEPLPGIPFLGALPSPGTEPGLIVALAPVGLGLGYALWRWMRGEQAPTLAAGALRLLGIFLAIFLLAFGAAVLASGAIGPERMAEIGINDPAGTALVLAGEITLGYTLVLTVRFWMARRRQSEMAAPLG